MLETLIIYGASLGVSEQKITERYNAYCDYTYMSMQIESFESAECDLQEVGERIYNVRTGKY